MLPFERRLLSIKGGERSPLASFTMYVLSLSDPVYHIAKDEHFTLCMIWIPGDPGRRRRWQDRKLVSELPAGRFAVLCKECERIAAEKSLEK